MNPDKMSRSELEQEVMLLRQQVTKYQDKEVSLKEACIFLGKTADWMYRAKSRPNTAYQAAIGLLVHKDGDTRKAGISFSLHELAVIKRLRNDGYFNDKSTHDITLTKLKEKINGYAIYQNHSPQPQHPHLSVI